MIYQVGDYVTRESYHHDVVFKIVRIRNETAYLKGVFKEKKIKIYPQDRVKVEFSIYSLDKGRIIQKYKKEGLNTQNFKSNSSRKIRNRRH